MTFDPWPALDAERTELADLLESLSPAQWDNATLCEGWRVREVAAHLRIAGTTTARSLAAGLLRHRFDFDSWMMRAAKEGAQAPTAELAAGVRSLVGSRHKPPVVKAIDPLCDTILHAQDIRRPLGLPRVVPAAPLLAVADHLVGNRFYKTPKRLQGLQVRMTDHAWEHGDGALVEGPGEAIVLMMTGRRAALDDLDGEGVATLRARC
ncbi:MAG: maleylpyruvate isomerase family mycothiol-dependent enzyme [Acidimicrobiales bacterium]